MRGPISVYKCDRSVITIVIVASVENFLTSQLWQDVYSETIIALTLPTVKDQVGKTVGEKSRKALSDSSQHPPVCQRHHTPSRSLDIHFILFHVCEELSLLKAVLPRRLPLWSEHSPPVSRNAICSSTKVTSPSIPDTPLSPTTCVHHCHTPHPPPPRPKKKTTTKKHHH